MICSFRGNKRPLGRLLKGKYKGTNKYNNKLPKISQGLTRLTFQSKNVRAVK